MAKSAYNAWNYIRTALFTLILTGMHEREAQNEHQVHGIVLRVISLLSQAPSLCDLNSIRNREVYCKLQ